MLFADTTIFKSTFYGSTSGTATSATIVYGSLDFTFQVGPATNANRTLQVAIPNIALRVPDPPDVDPSGGPVMLDVVGVCDKPSSGEMITVTLKSSPATY